MVGLEGQVGYRIKRRESPEEAARRIALEQTGAAILRLSEPETLGLAASIHDARKRCRKLRGLVRLVPPSRAKRARRLDRLFREAARELAGYRDAHAALATFDRLVASIGDDLPDGLTATHLAAVRAELARRGAEADAALAGSAETVERAISLLAEASERIQAWTADDDWAALATGLEVTYRAGAGQLAALREDPTADAGHELRKQAKYTWYHLRMLERSAPSVLTPLAGAFENLVEGLGDGNDLAVLQRLVTAEPDAFGGPEVVEPVAALLDEHHRRLRTAAVSSAGRLYAERPRAFARRLGGYWELWHTEGPERAIGPLAAPEAEPEPATEPAAITQPEPAPESALPDGDVDEISEDADEFDGLTVAQLRVLARQAGLVGHSRSRRDVLLAELRKPAEPASRD